MLFFYVFGSEIYAQHITIEWSRRLLAPFGRCEGATHPGRLAARMSAVVMKIERESMSLKKPPPRRDQIKLGG